MYITLEKLKKDMEEIAGSWNGDESGIAEENAHTAIEVIDLIDNINELVNNIK